MLEDIFHALHRLQALASLDTAVLVPYVACVCAGLLVGLLRARILIALLVVAAGFLLAQSLGLTAPRALPSWAGLAVAAVLLLGLLELLFIAFIGQEGTAQFEGSLLATLLLGALALLPALLGWLLRWRTKASPLKNGEPS